MKNNSPKPIIFVASGGMIVSSCTLGLIGILILFDEIKSGNYEGSVTVLSIFLFLLIWFGSMRILIEDKRLIYKTFLKSKSIEFQQIKSVKLEIGRRKEAFYSLVVSGFNKEEIVINSKPFSKNAMITLANHLILKSSQASFDKYILNMKENNFDIIAKQGVSNMWPILIKLFWILFIVTLVSSFMFK